MPRRTCWEPVAALRGAGCQPAGFTAGQRSAAQFRNRFLVLWLGALLLGAGCSPRQEPLAAVTGTVTLDEKPLPEGKISFVTTGKPPEVLSIKDGKFQGQTKIGKKRVEIRAYRTAQGKPKGPGAPDAAAMENYLPPAYNANSSLEADVTAAGPNNFSFSVKSHDK